MKIRTQLQRDLDENEPLQSISEHVGNANHTLKPHLVNEDSSFEDTLRLAERVMDSTYDDVFLLLLPVFHQFLHQFNKKDDIMKINVGIPFTLCAGWLMEWENELEAETHHKKHSSNIHDFKRSRNVLLFKRAEPYHNEKAIEIVVTSSPSRSKEKQKIERSTSEHNESNGNYGITSTIKA
eukprot:115583_1